MSSCACVVLKTNKDSRRNDEMLQIATNESTFNERCADDKTKQAASRLKLRSPDGTSQQSAFLSGKIKSKMFSLSGKIIMLHC